MAIVHDWNSSLFAAAAAGGTITITGSSIPSAGVVAYHIDFEDQMDLADVTRVRVKSGGQTIIDASRLELISMIQRLSRSNQVYVGGDVGFTIPLYIPDAKGDARYVSQMPKNGAVTIEIVYGAIAGASGAEGVRIGWTATDQEPAFFPTFIGEQLNVAASTTNQRFPITRGGLIRGFCIPRDGLNRIRTVLAGLQIEHGNAALFREFDRLQTVNGTTPATDPYFLKLHPARPATVGNSYFELDTGAAWGGVTDSVAILALNPQA